MLPLLSSLCSLLMVGVDAGSESAAMVLTAKAATVVRAGDDRPRPLTSMTLVVPGDEVRTTDKGDVLLVFFEDGHKERVKPGFWVTIGANLTRSGAPGATSGDRASAHERVVPGKSTTTAALPVASSQQRKTLWEAATTCLPPERRVAVFLGLLAVHDTDQDLPSVTA
jgi:hypothetical protein